jgi:hypothetical protein
MKVDPRTGVASLPNPLRIIGLSRILAALWFVVTGVRMLRQFKYLLPQAARLFRGDIGATDAPIRSLLLLLLAVAILVIGPVLAVKGWRWLHRLPLPPEGPAAIDPDEVVAVLRRHELPAYAERVAEPHRQLPRWLAAELADMTTWRRDIVRSAVRAFTRSCGLALVVAAVCVVLGLVTTDELLGPFPGSFVVFLPLVTAFWAGLALTLVPSHGPRVESLEFSVRTDRELDRQPGEAAIIESAPRMLQREPPGSGLALGITGVAVQCFLLGWWNLSPVGFPLIATSIIRHIGSIAGGILFFAVGDRMVKAGAESLLRFRYDSVLVLIQQGDGGRVARAAEIRSESRGLTGPRHVVAAVGGPYARESAERLSRG